MLKIRLIKTGRSKINTFRIGVVDIKMKRDTGRVIECLGYYQPQFKNTYLKLNTESYNKWVSVGACPTERVEKLFKIARADSRYLLNNKK